MNLYAKSFTYDGICSSDYDVILVSFESSNETNRETGITYQTQRSDATFNRDFINYYGRKFGDPLKFTVSLVKESGEAFSDKEYTDIVSWITSPKVPTLFTVEDYDGDTYHNGLEYFAVCTSFNECKMADVVGLTFQFECDRSYPITSEQTYSFTAPCTITINNTSEDLYSDCYPIIYVESSEFGEQTIQIKNENYPNDAMTLKVKGGQKLTIDNQSGDITDNLGLFNYATDTNLTWIHLKRGENKINITGKTTGEFRCRYVRKRGI